MLGTEEFSLSYARRERLNVSRNELAVELVYQTLIGVVRQTLMFARFAAEKQVQFPRCVIGYLLVVVEEARMRIQITLHVRKSRGDDRAFIQRLRSVKLSKCLCSVPSLLRS